MFGNHTPYDGVQRYRAGGSDVALLDKLCDTLLWCLCRHRGHLLRSRDQSATLMAAFTAARRLSGTDAGSARREAGLFGGERAFSRLAPEIAQRFGVCFDHNMLFESEVIESAVTAGVISVANAAKTAVETTLLHMATTTTPTIAPRCGIASTSSIPPSLSGRGGSVAQPTIGSLTPS